MSFLPRLLPSKNPSAISRYVRPAKNPTGYNSFDKAAAIIKSIILATNLFRIPAL